MGSKSKQWFGPESIKQGIIGWHVPPRFIYVDVSAKTSPKDLPNKKYTISKILPEINKPSRDTEVLWYFSFNESILFYIKSVIVVDFRSVEVCTSGSFWKERDVLSKV